MIPIELSQWLFNGNTPAMFVEVTCETIVMFVEERIDPVLFKAAMNNLFTPEMSDWFLLHLPVPLLRAASSPFTTTRVEPASVLLPERITELEFTWVKKVPAVTPDPLPVRLRSA